MCPGKMTPVAESSVAGILQTSEERGGLTEFATEDMGMGGPEYGLFVPHFDARLKVLEGRAANLMGGGGVLFESPCPDEGFSKSCPDDCLC